MKQDDSIFDVSSVIRLVNNPKVNIYLFRIRTTNDNRTKLWMTTGPELLRMQYHRVG